MHPEPHKLPTAVCPHWKHRALFTNVEVRKKTTIFIPAGYLQAATHLLLPFAYRFAMKGDLTLFLYIQCRGKQSSINYQ